MMIDLIMAEWHILKQMRKTQTATFQTWRLSKPGEKRFRTGHPWVFSNELMQSPKGAMPGELIRLIDSENRFLAIGYAHPNSVISLRVLSYRDESQIDGEWFKNRIRQASQLRALAQVDRQGDQWVSHRLIFAEADHLPGLIIDRYPVYGKDFDVFVAQTSTAGMDRLWPEILKGLEGFVAESGRDWSKTVVVLANDSKSRLLEGLAVEEKRIVHGPESFDAKLVDVVMQSSHHEAEAVKFAVDFIGGQKTGFFLDQRSNIQALSKLLEVFIASKAEKKIRVLDLCCYVGQWGTQIANVCKQFGVTAEVTSVDSSAKALELAKINVTAAGGICHAVKADVLGGLDVVENGKYDVVICDPPAFIKKKKDLPTGQAAYVKLNRESLAKLAKGGIYVSCSCSGLLTEEDFRNVLTKSVSAARFQKNMRWVFRGFHSPDHPQRPEFPQGTYLKSWIGIHTEA